MRGVIALELSRTGAIRARGQDMFDIAEGIAKDDVAVWQQVVAFPTGASRLFSKRLSMGKDRNSSVPCSARRPRVSMSRQGGRVLRMVMVGAPPGGDVDHAIAAL